MAVRRLVVDSSVVIKWFVPEDHSSEALALLIDHLDGKIMATAPSYLLLEVANALRKYVARGFIEEERALKAYNLLIEMSLELYQLDEELAANAMQYALQNHVTVYDAYYIVLAKRLNTLFYTADDKLLDRLRHTEPLVRHIADYGPPN